MRTILTLFITTLMPLTWPALAQSKDSLLAEAKQRCAPEQDGDLAVYRDDFKWGYNVVEMGARYQYIYNSGKRLPKRAYYDPATDQFYMDEYDYNGGRKKVALTDNFLTALRQHIEEALRRDYVQYVFFPDMGHAHAFIPQKYYDDVILKVPGNQGHLRYEKIFGFPGTKLLYHTAEQLHMKNMETKALVDDDFLRWRYYTRNLVGSLVPPAKIEIHKLLNENFNTVRNNPGYKYWGAGFDLSASKDGCFPFKTKSGEIHYFDISLHSLESDPNAETDWGTMGHQHQLWDPYHHMND